MTQLDKLKKLLLRKRGVSSIEAANALPSLCIHKRISELHLEHGWTILKKQDGKVKRYWGVKPVKD